MVEEEDYNDDNIKRDLELEIYTGNLMIAEYQVNKLKQRLSQQFNYYYRCKSSILPIVVMRARLDYNKTDHESYW